MARLLLPVLLLALLSACGPMPSLLGPSASERLQASAASLEAAGDFQGAAQLYLDEAARSAPPAQYSLQLQAADLLVRGKLFAPAHALLDRLQALGLQGDVQDQLTLRRARLALAEQHPDDALALLFLHLHPDVELAGITTILGNGTIETLDSLGAGLDAEAFGISGDGSVAASLEPQQRQALTPSSHGLGGRAADRQRVF